MIFLGAVESGIGCSQVNKILACANAPGISNSAYKRYERRVGAAIEKAAVISCTNAAEDERAAVISKMNELIVEL